MPLVFAGAPIVNVLVTMAIHPPKSAINPMLYVGFVLASIGAALVLYFRPSGVIRLSRLKPGSPTLKPREPERHLVASAFMRKIH